MTESFGHRMRQRREQQHIALGTIAEQTKIKLSLLEALEQDDVSYWPSGIFRRAFIRAYAHAIGLDPDVVVREFLELYPDPLEELIPTPSETPGSTNGNGARGSPPTRLRYLVDSAIGSMAARLRTRSAPRSSVEADNDVPVESGPARPHVVPGTPLTDSMTSSAGDPHEPAVAEPSRVEAVRAESRPVIKRAGRSDPDLLAIAELCTELGRVEKTREVVPLLERAAGLLDAVGLIVWIWDPEVEKLRAALAHGYSDKVIAQLPRVDVQANNATADAFRASQTCVVNSVNGHSGALAVPLLAPSGCVGVLAVELHNRGETRSSVRALAAIFAAQLATLLGAGQPGASPQLTA